MTCGRRWIEWDAERRGEIVAPASGKNSQRGTGSGEAIHSFVHSAITAAHKDSIKTASGSIARQALHLPTSRGNDHLEIVAEPANYRRGGKRDTA